MKSLARSRDQINLYNSGFIFLFPVLNNMLASDIDTDPVRRWVAKIISEDTTYYAPKNLLTIDTISNKMAGPRLMRWEFAWQVYKEEFNIKQKLFGGGFNFLNWFGYKFVRDKTTSDYPHNPFLSILLYSGLVGFLIYLILFYKVIYYNVLYYKEYPIISIFFAITFFFSFFSAGSPFDPPIMGFFILLPFFMHNILYPKSLPNE
jgi:O-antigen ligase